MHARKAESEGNAKHIGARASLSRASFGPETYHKILTLESHLGAETLFFVGGGLEIWRQLFAIEHYCPVKHPDACFKISFVKTERNPPARPEDMHAQPPTPHPRTVVGHRLYMKNTKTNLKGASCLCCRVG